MPWKKGSSVSLAIGQALLQRRVDWIVGTVAIIAFVPPNTRRQIHQYLEGSQIVK